MNPIHILRKVAHLIERVPHGQLQVALGRTGSEVDRDMNFVGEKISKRNRILNGRCGRGGNLSENKLWETSNADREKNEACKWGAARSIGSSLRTSRAFFATFAVKSF